MALEVAGVFARLGARVDESGFDRFDRRLDKAEARAKHGVNTKVDVNTESAQRGLRGYGDELDHVDRRHGDLVRGSGRLRTAMGSLFIGGAGFAGVALGAGLAAKGAMSAVDAFKESEVIGKRTNNVLETTGHAAGVSAKQVGDLATSLSRKSGVDDEVIQSGENVLLTFTNIRNEAGKGNDIFTQTTGAALDLSQALGQDLQSSTIQLGKALNDPVKGVSALQRVGVSFTAQQKDQIKTLVAHGKTLAAQKLILGEVKKEFGGAAEASATWGNKLKVTFGNLQEAVGKVIAPTFDKAAKGLTNFVNGMTDGTGAGGKFVATLRGIGQGAKDGITGLVDFVKHNENAHRIIGNVRDILGRLWTAAKQVGRGVADAFRGMGPELVDIGKFVLRLYAVFSGFYDAVVKRSLPGIVASLKGLAQVVRGIVDVISGLVTLKFGRVWQGLERIVGGVVKAIGGALRSLTAPFRELVSRATDAGAGVVRGLVNKVKRLPGDLWDALKGAVGKVADLGASLATKAASAGATLVKRLIGKANDLPGALWGAIKGGLDRLGQFERSAASAAAKAGARLVRAAIDKARALPGDLWDALKSAVQTIGRLERAFASAALDAGKALIRGIVDGIKSAPGAIVDAIKGAIPGGKLGSIARKVIPGLAAGGRVGPTAGGPSLFIAGEGNADEWVISQEGNRSSNVQWAREALETLTGRRVELYRTGKGAKKKKARKPLKKILTPGQQTSAVGEQERGLKNFDRDLARLERQYGQLARENDQSQEDFVVEHEDGSTTIDDGAVKKRVKELDAQMAFLKDKIGDKLREYRTKITAALGVYNTIIARLTHAIGRANGSRRSSERAGYVNKRAQYLGRRSELSDKFDDLGLDLEDNRLDIQDLTNEKADVTGQKPTAAPDTGGDTTPDTAAPDTGGNDPSSSAPAPIDTAPQAPSALELAEAAAAQVRAYESGRADLLSSMGAANFMVPGSLAGGVTEAQEGAGARYFGAGGSGADSSVLAAGGVQQTINVTIADAGDVHTFTQGALHELQAAV